MQDFFNILLTKLYYMIYSIINKTILMIDIILYRNQKRSEPMVFNTGAALLDAIVLAIVSKEQDGTYGYKITQDVRTKLK